MCRNNQTNFQSCFFASAISLAFLGCLTSSVKADDTYAHDNDGPEIQMWFYPTASANGSGSVRDRGTTFSFDEPGDGFSTSRGGSILVAANTSTDIPLLADPSRYQIDSLKVTLNFIGSQSIIYDNTPDDVAAVTTGVGDDPGNPVELWGVGFDDNGDYETFGFNGETEDKYFNLRDRRWKISAGNFTSTYQLFNIDPSGNDVDNALVGGFSATEPSGNTTAFTPTPFAVGKVYDEFDVELTPGTLLDGSNDTTFEFEPDLSNPGILSYIRNSLAEGHLGFFFSSLHLPSGQVSTVPFPDFYLDDWDDGLNPDGGPTIEIQVTVLDEIVLGDYSGNGTVGPEDYMEWELNFGASVTPGTGADGNGNGTIDAADYTVWRDNLPSNGAATAAGQTVPEPSSMLLLSLALILQIAGRWRSVGSNR